MPILFVSQFRSSQVRLSAMVSVSYEIESKTGQTYGRKALSKTTERFEKFAMSKRTSDERSVFSRRLQRLIDSLRKRRWRPSGHIVALYTQAVARAIRNTTK